MHAHLIDGMVASLTAAGVVADEEAAKAVLRTYWSTRIAFVWNVSDVFRAANDNGNAVTEAEARTILADVLRSYDCAVGMDWDTFRSHASGRGRALTKKESRLVLRGETVHAD